MKQYLNLINNVLKKGENRTDRTGVGTISLFGVQEKYDLREGFPLVTTKKVFLKAIIHELLWILKGDTNIKYLVDNGVKIWNEWPYEKYKNSSDYNGENLEEFIEKIKTDKQFANKFGDLGPVYGKQWRNFGGVDQIKNIIDQIKNNPDSRRIIVSSWNPPEIPMMALPPCHSFFQFYVTNNKELDLQLYQRSGDIFLGVPFNIASYSILLMIIAKECDLEPRNFIHTIGDAHIYKNHLDQVKLQLSRTPKKLPNLKININNKSIFDLDYEDFELIDYSPHPTIKGEVAV